MKKLILIIMLLALTAFCACAGNNSGESGENAQTSEQADKQTSHNQPSDEEIISLYKKAVEAYGWFDLCTMPITDERRIVDGQQYSKVNYPGISTVEQLRAYLNTLFTPELTDKLLRADGKYIMYRDIDGELYAIDAARGSDISRGEERYAITRKDDGSIAVHVDVDILDISGEGNPDELPVVGTAPYDFVLVPENDKWVFANFELTR